MPPSNFARRGGKVHNSQRTANSPSQRRPGLGLGKGTAIRRRIVAKDTILGITKGDLRRLARRGGVKRISADIYDTARQSLRDFVRDVPSSYWKQSDYKVVRDCVIFVEHGRRKTVLVTDVVFALRRRGRPIYGFERVSGNFSRG